MTALDPAPATREAGPGDRHLGGFLVPGLALVVGGTIAFDGFPITAAFRGSSPVPDDQLSFPWFGATAIATSTMWGFAWLLVTIGLIGFARSAPYGGGRAARAGAWVAVVGMALNVPAHGLSIALRDAKLDEPQVIVVLSLFGVGTLLTAIGMMLAGVGTIRAGMWSGWRRWVPLAVGLTAFALLALQVTPLLQEAVGLYSIALAALGVAVLVEGPRRSPAG
jgi:hypothetical protein